MPPHASRALRAPLSLCLAAATALTAVPAAAQDEGETTGKRTRVFAGADVISAQGDPDSMQISYTVEYLRQDGSKSRDDVTLTLEGTDGDFLIAGES